MIEIGYKLLMKQMDIIKKMFKLLFFYLFFGRYINDLILLYQMEHRTKLRVALLHVFGCCCQLGEEFVSALLCSVLPTELAQDLMQDQSDMTKMLTTALMLTMIFSTGEAVPYHHYVQVRISNAQVRI